MLQESVEQGDPFDPNNWGTIFAAQDAEPCHIYLDNDGRICALIDPIDYQFATRWRWCPKKDPTGSIYARRAVGENVNGQRLRTFSIYLHIVIMKRTGKRRPTPKHFLVDHRNGDSLDCRRRNLRWATVSMNAHNRFNARPRDLVED